MQAGLQTQITAYVYDSASHPVDTEWLGRRVADHAYNRQGGSRPVFVRHRGNLVWDEAARAAILASLRDAWRDVAELNLAGGPDERSDAGLPEHEMVILVILADKGGRAWLGLVYPQLTLEPYIRLLSL